MINKVAFLPPIPWIHLQRVLIYHSLQQPKAIFLKKNHNNKHKNHRKNQTFLYLRGNKNSQQQRNNRFILLLTLQTYFKQLKKIVDLIMVLELGKI